MARHEQPRSEQISDGECISKKLRECNLGLAPPILTSCSPSCASADDHSGRRPRCATHPRTRSKSCRLPPQKCQTQLKSLIFCVSLWCLRKKSQLKRIVFLPPVRSHWWSATRIRCSVQRYCT